jgi:hypothetical protein
MKLPLMTKLDQNYALLENAMRQLRLWLNFLAAQQCNAMNVVVTSHLPLCLYSAAGVKVNRQVAPYPLNSHPHPLNDGPRCVGDESPDRAYLLHGGATSRSYYFNRFSATSSGKVFFGPSAFQSLGQFFTDQARYEKRSSTAKGLLLGVCFVAEGPVRKTPSKDQHRNNAEATF